MLRKPGFWVGVLLVIIAIALTPIRCYAQTDTIPCKMDCIKNTVIATTPSGADRIYLVYSDPETDIQDMISVSKSVYEYIELCKKNNIKPQIGIRFKNGQIISIVRYKKHYKIKR